MISKLRLLDHTASPECVAVQRVVSSIHISKGLEQTMTALDESLLSLEKLDRTSPELWPEQIPGVSDYMHLNALSTHPLPKLWNKPLDQDDYNLMIQLGNLSHGALIAEVKKLHDAAYKLGLEEAKEMTKGKYLNVLSKKKYLN